MQICLDTLKPQPQGSWSPSININTLLLSLQLLMSTPNAEDGLVPHITEQYKRNKQLYLQAARAHTLLHAVVLAVDNNSQSVDVYSHRIKSSYSGVSSSTSTSTSTKASNDTENGTPASNQCPSIEDTHTTQGTDAAREIHSAVNTTTDSTGAAKHPVTRIHADGESHKLYSEGYVLIGCNSSAHSIQHMQTVMEQAATEMCVPEESDPCMGNDGAVVDSEDGSRKRKR